MKQTGKRLCALLLTAAMALSMLPVAAFAQGVTAPEGLEGLIRPGLTVTASSQGSPAQSPKEAAIDNDLGTQWSSENMKDAATMAANGGDQKPQWLMVDLGEDRTYPIAIDSIRLDYNMMVWPMVYRIETTGDDPTDQNADWTTLVSVSRDPFKGSVKDGDGQNITIADPIPADATTTPPNKAISDATTGGTNGDLITKTTVPALASDAAVQRYVRFYVEKVNTEAGGDDTGLREFQIYVPASDEPVGPIVGAWNLALGQPTNASGHDGASTSDRAVDGKATSDYQWSSANMKTSATTENDTQTPQWLWVDLGHTGSRIDQIKLWYNLRVWPMVYEIQTTDGDPNAQSTVWETVVRVERSPFNGAVKNGAGQDIADETGNTTPDTAANTDTITTTSNPRLQKTTLKRYVRFFAIKVNTLAPGNNTGLREIEIYGVNENRRQPVDVADILASATNTTVSAGGTAVTLPAAPSGATLAVAGSSLENVVANDGTVSQKNIGAREVKLLVRAWDNAEPGAYQQKNLTVTVPDHKGNYPAAWFPTVASPNPKPEVIPSIQEWYGYTGSFKLNESSRIVINDAANVGLGKAAANMKADVKEISGLDLPVVTGTSGGANDIYIESLTADSYDLGKEGYLMRVSGDGVQIYAPTYTGCIFGTITVEQILWQAADHLSVPMGIMRDYPAYEVRGLKLDIGRAPTRYQQLQDYAKIMLWYKMSEYDLHINDTENPNASNATDSKNNIGFHRLESDTFPSLKDMPGVKKAGVDPNLVDEDYYNDPNGYGGNPVYTKQQWKDLAQLAKDYGMYLLTEIDMPGHALAYNQYVEKYPAEAAKAGVAGPIRSTDTTNFRSIELLDLTGANAANALAFAKALWDEYTSDGTISGKVVHIGADEYWLDSTEVRNAFARFADSLREVIQDNLGEDTKIRMWGEGSAKFSTATTALGKTHAQLAEVYELEIWATGYDNPVQRSRDGYKLVNCEQSAMYSCPGRYGRDVPNAEYLFNSWDPTVFGGSRLLYGDPNLLGAKAVMWGEQTQEGLTERDVNQRVLRAIAIISEKTWTGTQQSEGTFSDYEMRAARLAEGPGTQIAMNVPSETSLVLDYDFKNISTDGRTVYDASGNGYNGALSAAGTVDADGFLAFNGSTLLTTGLTTLSYPYTVSFDLKAGAGNDKDSSLFSGYDGRIQVAGHNGKLSANACSFIRDFNYTVPTDGTVVNITLVGTFQATRLYVNGQLAAFLSQTEDKDGVAAGAITSYFSSVPLPLEEIGKGFHGAMANLKVYNKAMTAAEIAAVRAGTDDGLVNVAQDAAAGGSSYHAGDGYDIGQQRTGIAQKAVDGEEEEMYSYWRADHSDSTLTVDLGQTRAISSIEAKWQGSDPGSTLQTSADGAAWTSFTNGGAAVNARYVRLTANGAGNLKELLVYEDVRAKKAELANSLEEAEEVAVSRGLGFESTDKADQADFADLVFARAVMDDPLATIADVERAIDGLKDQLLVPVTGITLDKTEATIYTNAGDGDHTVTLTPTVKPDTATRKGVSWTTSNPDAATVHEGVVTANGVGTAIITATAADGSGMSAACTVTVKTKLENSIAITGDAKYDSTLTVELNRLQMPEADQNKMGIQWYRTVEGAKEAITGATERTYKLAQADIGAVISVTATAAAPYEGTREASIPGAVTKADGLPIDETPGYEDCTTAANNDGRLTGLRADRLYDYQAVGAGDNWTRVPQGSTEIAGLGPGNYHIRRAETATHFAGKASETVTILGFGLTGYNVSIAPRFTGGVVRADAQRAAAGAAVTLTLDPETGYELVEGSLKVYKTGEPTEGVAVTGNSFTMPAYNVTVVAQFAKQKFTLTHELKNIDCDQETSGHEVEYGGKPAITLTPVEGYWLPTAVKVTVTGSTTEFEAYDYLYNADRSSATITFTGGVTSHLTISGEGVRKSYNIDHDLKNLVCSLPSDGHRVEHGALLSITLTPDAGFLPPARDGVTITMGGQTFDGFDYAVDAEKGTGTITIEAGKITGSLKVTATAVKAVPVTGVTLDRTSAALKVGESITLRATVLPADAADQPVAWSSGDPAVATVDQSGKVTGVGAGSAVITAAAGGSHTATCTVTVTETSGGTFIPSLPSTTTPNTTTTTTTNPDGTKTTTVTDTKTGTVTATTEKKDGTVEVVETKPDGTKTETTKNTDGSSEVVETKPDGTVTETNTDTEGGKVEKVTTPEKDVAITVTDNQGEVLAKVEIPAEIPAPETRFVDVPEGHWADEAIHNMAALDVVNGVGNNTFDRNGDMKRGDLALVLSRMSSANDKSYDLTFDDVPASKYYANGVAWAAKTGVVTGRSAETFAPEATITREELAVMLYRYAKLLKLDAASPEGALDAFKDGGDTHGWAEEGMAWCVNKGILQGKGNGVLDPRTNVTRAEVAVMLQRFMDLMK